MLIQLRCRGIGHDENVHKDPYTFNPERFLGPDAEPEFATLPFGLGRRICPGLHLADSSLFLYVAGILTMFRIGLPKDDGGREYTPNVQFSSGVIRSVYLPSLKRKADKRNSIPEPFKCSITARFPSVAASVLFD